MIVKPMAHVDPAVSVVPKFCTYMLEIQTITLAVKQRKLTWESVQHTTTPRTGRAVHAAHMHWAVK